MLEICFGFMGKAFEVKLLLQVSQRLRTVSPRGSTVQSVRLANSTIAIYAEAIIVTRTVYISASREALRRRWCSA